MIYSTKSPRFTLGDKLFCAIIFRRARSSEPAAKQRRQKRSAIESITIYQLRIPFHQAFSHALQSREESDAVIVKVTGSDGGSGFGESLPRSYVTGETTESMIARIRDHLAPRIFRRNFHAGLGNYRVSSARDAGLDED